MTGQLTDTARLLFVIIGQSCWQEKKLHSFMYVRMSLGWTTERPATNLGRRICEIHACMHANVTTSVPPSAALRFVYDEFVIPTVVGSLMLHCPLLCARWHFVFVRVA